MRKVHSRSSLPLSAISSSSCMFAGFSAAKGVLVRAERSVQITCMKRDLKKCFHRKAVAIYAKMVYSASP